jgi:hypothetical protein
MTLQGQRIDLIEVSDKVYVRGKDFWRKYSSDTFAQLAGDRWVSVDATDPNAQRITAGFATFTHPEKFAASLDAAADQVVKGDEATVDGRDVVTLRDKSGNPLFVATRGAPYPVQLSTSRTQHIDFDQFNAAFSVTAPSHALNLSALVKGQGGSMTPWPSP